MLAAMKLDKAFHRTLEDGTKFHAEAFGSFSHFVAECIGYRTYEMDGEPGTTVLLDIAHEEIDKTVDEQVVYFGNIAML